MRGPAANVRDTARCGLMVAMDAGSMDAVSAVLGAMAASAGAGAGDAIKDMTKATITGIRDRLISAVRRRLKKDPVGDAKLTVYAAEPTVANGEALQGHLVAADLDYDPQILTLARELIAAVGPAALGDGSVAAQIINQTNTQGGTGFIGGHHVHHHTRETSRQARWEVLHIKGGLFELRNAGDVRAHDVQVTVENAVRFDSPRADAQWPAGSGHEFLAIGSAQTGHPDITVTWRDDLGERHSWTRPLPR